MDMLSGVQTGNGIPLEKYNIRGIDYASTNKKDNILMQRGLVQCFTYKWIWAQKERIQILGHQKASLLLTYCDRVVKAYHGVTSFP